MIYDEKTLNIFGKLTVKNEITGKIITIKSDVTDIPDCNVIIEELLGELYYKIDDFSNCKSEMMIYIEIKTAGTPIIELNRTYLKILNKINSKVLFDISYKM